MTYSKSLESHLSHSMDSQPGRAAWSSGLNVVTLQIGRLEPREGKGFARYTRAWAASGRVLGLVFLGQGP